MPNKKYLLTLTFKEWMQLKDIIIGEIENFDKVTPRSKIAIIHSLSRKLGN